jgi:para-nitrobenzyl esterase
LAEYKALASQMYGEKAADLLALYPAATDAEATRQAQAIGRDSGFTLGARTWAREQTRTGKQPAYLFMVSRVQPFTPGVTYSDFEPATAGAYHMGDVPYWLGTYEAFNLFRRTRDWTAWDRELSTLMQDVVVAFATTGNPSTAATPFTRYAPGNETRVDFGDSVQVEKLNTRGMDFLESTPAARAAGRGRGRP